MNLLYVLSEFPPDFGGGIATVYGQLLPSLVAEGDSVTVILANSAHCDQPSYDWQGVHVIPLQHRYLTHARELMRGWQRHAFVNTFLPTAWAAWLQCRVFENVDLVEVTDWALLFIPWLLQERHYPVVVALHGSSGQVDWHVNPITRSGDGSLVRFLEASLLPRADHLLANSELNACFWKEQGCIHTSVIPPTLSGSSIPSLPLSSNRRGLVIGRLQNWKGAELLCKALQLLPDQQVDWIGADTCWLNGTETASSFLRRHYPDVVDSQLHLLGCLPPPLVQGRLCEASFLCVPSLWDVFNVTVLEAVSLGIPVLCSQQAGASMLIEHEKTGFLFDPNKPDQLASLIQTVMHLSHNERSSLVYRAFRHFSETLSLESTLKRYQSLYSAVISDFKPRTSSEWLYSAILDAFGLNSTAYTSEGFRGYAHRTLSRLKNRFFA